MSLPLHRNLPDDGSVRTVMLENVLHKIIVIKTYLIIVLYWFKYTLNMQHVKMIQSYFKFYRNCSGVVKNGLILHT
jgi:hypothetical protein